MLNTALTFDYELFFGENFGSSDEILFEPTRKLLNSLDKHNVKATFFADVLSVYMHEKYGLNDYCDKFISQIRDMINRGHDVQLHIHSNWLRSKYENKTWIFDIESYRIHSFSFDQDSEMSVPEIIKWGKTFLESNLKPVAPDYKCIAYRAGGYSIQPHDQLFRCLLDNGIYIDSSIAMMQEAHSVNEYNFKNVPDINGWWIGVDSSINDPVDKRDDAMYEIPVAYYRQSLFKRLFMPKIEKAILHTLKGSYIKLPPDKDNNAEVQHRSLVRRLLDYNKFTRILSFDDIHYKLIIQTLNKREKACYSPNQTISIIGHPKIIDELWIQNFDAFLSEAKKHKQLNFVIFRELTLD